MACFMLIKSSRWNRVFIYRIIYCYPERTGNFQEVIYMQLVPFKPFCREIGMFEKKMENLWKNFFDETSFAKPFTEKWVPTVDVSDT